MLCLAFFFKCAIICRKATCRYGSSVEHQLPKLERRVRLPLSAYMTPPVIRRFFILSYRKYLATLKRESVFLIRQKIIYALVQEVDIASQLCSARQSVQAHFVLLETLHCQNGHIILLLWKIPHKSQLVHLLRKHTAPCSYSQTGTPRQPLSQGQQSNIP